MIGVIRIICEICGLKLSNIILHIGYSKAASTWLQNIFQQTATIHYYHKPKLWRNSEGKIFWSNDVLLNIVKENLNSGNPILISNEHLILPGIHPILKCATTNLSYVQNLAEFIVENLSDPKVILMIRRQDAIIASRYHQYIMQGGSLKFIDFLSHLMPDNDPSEYCDYRFYGVISALKKIIGENNLIVKTVDEIKSNPDTFLKTCSEFIGDRVALHENTFNRKINVGFSRFAAQIVRVINSLLVLEKENAEKRTLTRIPFKIWLYLVVAIWKLDNKIFINRKRPPIMNAEQQATVRDIFKNDNLRLANNFDQVKNWL